jgi:hypothetical protein
MQETFKTYNMRGAPLPPLPKHCKSAVSRWSDARGPSETSDWPIYRHVEPPHCRKHCRLAPILSGQSLPTLPHGGRGTTAGTAVATLPPPRTPPRACLEAKGARCASASASRAAYAYARRGDGGGD